MTSRSVISWQLMAECMKGLRQSLWVTAPPAGNCLPGRNHFLYLVSLFSLNYLWTLKVKLVWLFMFVCFFFPPSTKSNNKTLIGLCSLQLMIKVFLKYRKKNSKADTFCFSYLQIYDVHCHIRREARTLFREQRFQFTQFCIETWLFHYCTPHSNSTFQLRTSRASKTSFMSTNLWFLPSSYFTELSQED